MKISRKESRYTSLVANYVYEWLRKISIYIYLFIYWGGCLPVCECVICITAYISVPGITYLKNFISKEI